MSDPFPHKSSVNAEASRVPATSASAASGQAHGSQQPYRRPARTRFSFRQIALPVGAIVMACLFYVYSRTAVQAAKVNAKRHRDADGGTINWRNESLRRHGVLEKPEERTLWQQLTSKGDDEQAAEEARNKARRELQERRKRGDVNLVEEAIRKAREDNRSE